MGAVHSQPPCSAQCHSPPPAQPYYASKVHVHTPAQQPIARPQLSQRPPSMQPAAMCLPPLGDRKGGAVFMLATLCERLASPVSPHQRGCSHLSSMLFMNAACLITCKAGKLACWSLPAVCNGLSAHENGGMAAKRMHDT